MGKDFRKDLIICIQAKFSVNLVQAYKDRYH